MQSELPQDKYTSPLDILDIIAKTHCPDETHKAFRVLALLEHAETTKQYYKVFPDIDKTTEKEIIELLSRLTQGKFYNYTKISNNITSLSQQC